MEIGSNQEHLDQTGISMTEFDSVLNELESVDEHIEERIRHIEAASYRFRDRQRCQQSHLPFQISNSTGGLTTADVQDEDRVHREEVGIAVHGKTDDRRERGKRKSTHLVAKALGMDTNTENFFDCNICLDMARDPVLTCCGHLFCWPCFYKLPYAYSDAKECPVCEGEVTETGVIPIYGDATVSSSSRLESKEAGLSVPPRPRAFRTESTAQQLRSRGMPSSTIREIRRFNNYTANYSGLGQQFRQEIPESAINRTNAFSGVFSHSSTSQLQALSSPETENNQPTHSHQFSSSGSLGQGADSVSSFSSALSSAMDSAERLVEDLESYIYNDHTGRNRRQSTRAVNGDSPSSIAATATNQSEIQIADVAATNSAAAASVSPWSMNNDATAVIESEMQTTNSSVQIISSHPSASSSRRTDVLSLDNIDSVASNEPRRRRLR